MNRQFCATAAAGILSATLLPGCGVRDTSEDATLSTENLGTLSEISALGSDTSEIAGFWAPDFSSVNNQYVLISEDGEWSYFSEDTVDNCYNVDTHELTLIDIEEFSIDEDGNVYTFNAYINDDGDLYVEIAGELTSTVLYSAVPSIVAEDLLEC